MANSTLLIGVKAKCIHVTRVTNATGLNNFYSSAQKNSTTGNEPVT
ncbi:MAG TPA: hypothetical protein VJ981_00340 [Gammaproteobacteria bacterium]|nr:hypothetical protein [Gammaproteobacteria bacterium]